MLQRRGSVILAVGAFSLSSAFAQAETSVSLGEIGIGGDRLDAEPSSAAAKQTRAQQPPPSGNPLWGVPIDKLTATQERPLFTASRRPPAPPVAPEPSAEPPPPPPPEPERPLLTLVGTVTGELQKVAVVQDQTTKSFVRLHVGEAVSGWSLHSIDAQRVAVEKNNQTVTVALPARGSPPAGPPAVAEARAGQSALR
jgi:general secretion pathway protein N